jgi:hypothetical protein
MRAPTSQDPKKRKIGGWLNLVALWMVLAPLITVCGTLLVLPDVLWFGPLGLAVFLGIQVLIFTFECVLTWSFFSRKPWTPMLLVVFQILKVAEAATSDVMRLVFYVVWASVWITYFFRSKRVKATFFGVTQEAELVQMPIVHVKVK